MRPLTFKAEEEDIARWKEEAHHGRISVGEWIRRKLNAAPAPAAPSLLALATKETVPGSLRKCEHRIPPGSWCKSCQTIKK